MDDAKNPLEPLQSLKRALDEQQVEGSNSQQSILPTDSAVTKGEKIEGHGTNGFETNEHHANGNSEPSSKRVKTEVNGESIPRQPDARDKVRGIALVKPE
jgi:tRNA-dihydrouridine synthase 3